MSDLLPSRPQALRILLHCGCSPQVISHCKAVEECALKIAKTCKNSGLSVDIKLVQIGSLLHDIGRSRTHSVDHAIIGAEIVRSLGLPSSLRLLIERHVGGGVTKDEAKKLGWPPKDYVPQTIEEKIVAYADKLINGTRKVDIQQTTEIFSKELGNSHPAIERIKKLHIFFESLIK